MRRWRGAKRGAGGIAELLAIAFPLIISQACETLMMFTDRLFLAKTGPENMSAAMGGGLTSFMFMTFFVGIVGYSNALVAQHLGAQRRGGCAMVVSQAIWISLLAYPLALCLIPAGIRLFRFAGIAPEQLAPQTVYFRLMMLGSIFGLLRNSFSSFFSGIGRAGIILKATAVSLLVNIVANYVLIFGKLGFPALGILGAAYGTIMGSASGMLIVASVYFGEANRTRFLVMESLRFDLPMMKKLLRYGMPAGTELFLNVTAFNFLVMLFHSYGVAVAAAVTIAFNWDLLSFIPPMGLNIAVSSLVGRYMGAEKPDSAHRSAMSGIKLASLYSISISLLFLLLPETLVSVFNPAGGGSVFDEARPTAVFMVRLVGLYVFADSMGIVFSGALRGAGDTFITMLLSVGAHWLIFLVLLPLVKWLGISPELAWLSIVLQCWLIALLLYARYRSGAWRSIRLIEKRGLEQLV